MQQTDRPCCIANKKTGSGSSESFPWDPLGLRTNRFKSREFITMSDNVWDTDDNDDDNENGAQANGPAELRKALKAANAAAKKANAERDELNTKFAELEKTVKSQSLKELTKELPPALQKWIAKADLEPTAEAVAGWITENGADFGYTPQESLPEGGTAGEQRSFSDEYRQGQQRAQSLGGAQMQGNSPSGDVDARLKDIALQAAGNPEAFYALLNKTALD
jgi:hypothetical protein